MNDMAAGIGADAVRRKVSSNRDRRNVNPQRPVAESRRRCLGLHAKGNEALDGCPKSGLEPACD